MTLPDRPLPGRRGCPAAAVPGLLPEPAGAGAGQPPVGWRMSHVHYSMAPPYVQTMLNLLRKKCVFLYVEPHSVKQIKLIMAGFRYFT